MAHSLPGARLPTLAILPALVHAPKEALLLKRMFFALLGLVRLYPSPSISSSRAPCLDEEPRPGTRWQASTGCLKKASGRAPLAAPLAKAEGEPPFGLRQSPR